MMTFTNFTVSNPYIYSFMAVYCLTIFAFMTKNTGFTVVNFVLIINIFIDQFSYSYKLRILHKIGPASVKIKGLMQAKKRKIS